MDDDDEWEYEYDEDETEAVYITIDFSARTPAPIAIKKANGDTGIKNGPHKQSRNKAKTGAATPGEEREEEDEAAIDDKLPGQIQILDLHTPNPLISYNSQVYTCHWATDIGTTLHIAPPREDSDAHPPLRSYPGFDILAKTRTRLVAVPARLKPATQGPQQPALPTDPDTTTMSIDTPEGDSIIYASNGALHISIPPGASTAKAAQARFLARWAELRAANGQTSLLPIKPIKSAALPEGWEAERAAWLARDREEALAAGIMPRRRRRAPQQTVAERRVRFRLDQDGEGSNADGQESQEDVDDDEGEQGSQDRLDANDDDELYANS